MNPTPFPLNSVFTKSIIKIQWWLKFVCTFFLSLCAATRVHFSGFIKTSIILTRINLFDKNDITEGHLTISISYKFPKYTFYLGLLTRITLLLNFSTKKNTYSLLNFFFSIFICSHGTTIYIIWVYNMSAKKLQ